MITVKISQSGAEALIARTETRAGLKALLADADVTFAGTGALVTVHCRGEHRAMGDWTHKESA
jgi:hypothetical protein